MGVKALRLMGFLGVRKARAVLRSETAEIFELRSKIQEQ
jgi:hypothetical protein